MHLDQHPDQDVAAAARDPNAGGLSPRELAIEAAKRLAAVSNCDNTAADAVRISREIYGADSSGISRDYATCLNYLISLDQPDDGPITAEWLESIGGESEDGWDWIVPVTGDLSMSVDIGEGDAALVYICQEADLVYVRKTTSRADLLRLIDGLKGGAQ